VVESIDLMPTLLGALGLPVPVLVQGHDLGPLIRGEGASEWVAVTESPYRGRRIAAANHTTRLILTEESGRTELYHYRIDPLELDDRAAAEPDAVSELEDAIERWRVLAEILKAPASQEGPEWSDEQLEQLRTLGYVE